MILGAALIASAMVWEISDMQQFKIEASQTTENIRTLMLVTGVVVGGVGSFKTLLK